MPLSSRLFSHAWIAAVILACGVVIYVAAVRAGRMAHVSEIGIEALKIDPHSPTGYANGMRKLVVPERNAASYQWVVQTQQMLARGEWRLRRADYDNAPTGRPVHTASAYRWWLGGIATILAVFSGEASGAAVERAALWAGPLGQILLIIGTAIVAARRFGPAPASLLSVGLALLYPLGGAFTAGQPDDIGFSCALALWSVLLLVPYAGATATTRRAYVLAGAVGGLGLWINARVQVPVILGIVLGAWTAAWLSRRSAPPSSTVPWRAWAIAGAIASVATYLLEYFPSHIDFKSLRLETNHPLYALAWLGLGELLARAAERFRGGWFVPDGRRGMVLIGLSALAITSVAASMRWHKTKGFLAADPADPRLTNLPDGAIANNVGEWFAREGPGAPLVITLLPLLAIMPAVWILVRRRSEPDSVARIGVALGPVLVFAGLSAFRLRAWSVLDALLLALVVAWTARAGAKRSRTANAAFALLAVAVLLPAWWLMWPSARARSTDAVTESEAQSLVERDIAHWLASRAGAEPVVVLAPPALASSLVYYGGLRAVATPYGENFDGFAGAVRLAAATSMAEAESLARRRQLSYIVLPSWDTDLDAYARLGTTTPDDSLIARLNRWLPPLWLRPLAYKLPAIEGLANRSIAIFAVVDMQEDALALSRLGEYFAEMGQGDFAARVAATLEQKYPEDVSGIVARAQVAAANNNAPAFGEVLGALLPALTRQDDAHLPWDRRVNLAIVLAQAKRADLARGQLQRCLEEMDASLLRALSPGSLYRFLTLLRRSEMELPTAELREVARQILPAEARAQLL